MKTVLHKSNERGHADHGWLKAYHTFSFASWYNPEQVHFGMLRVLNDDTVAPGTGFGRHPHDNMEIVTIPLKGELKHSDSTGGSGIIKAGEVQIMSAGKGVFHSEMNPSQDEAVSLLQTWVFPKERNIEPRYDQRAFPKEERLGKLRVVVSPDEKDGGMWINQDAWYSLGSFDAETTIDYTMHKPGNGVYIFVIEGSVEAAGQKADKRDGLGVWDAETFPVKIGAGSELLLIEVPMK